MSSRMDEFREFVKKYPGVRDDVTNGKKTWQKIYEDWVILGEADPIWKPYAAPDATPPRSSGLFSKGGLGGMFEGITKNENLKNVMGYVKKINPDNVSKTLNTVQKVLQITQSFGGKAAPGLYNANYNSWWD